MTARVPMVSLERARELGEAMGMPARRTQSEAFRTVANNPGVARVAFSQLMQLLENNKFDTRLRELMIMRIGWVTGSAYEWTQHWRVATTAGIPPEDVLAVRDWRNSDRLTPADKAILAATDECLAGKSISDAAWAEVVTHVTDPGQQVEFVIAMGNWMMFSLLFRNLRIPLAEGLMVWPPDGLASPAADTAFRRHGPWTALRSINSATVRAASWPPIGYHSGAIVTVWPTTCRSRQHSASRLSRLNEVLPPWRYTRSIASRALSAA